MSKATCLIAQRLLSRPASTMHFMMAVAIDKSAAVFARCENWKRLDTSHCPRLAPGLALAMSDGCQRRWRRHMAFPIRPEMSKGCASCWS